MLYWDGHGASKPLTHLLKYLFVLFSLDEQESSPLATPCAVRPEQLRLAKESFVNFSVERNWNRFATTIRVLASAVQLIASYTWIHVGTAFYSDRG